MHTNEDIQLAAQVRNALAVSAGGMPAVTVVAEHGVVTLSGVVRNETERRNTVSAALSVAGVTDVKDHLRIEDEEKSSVGEYVDDALITAEVKAALLTEPGIKSLAVGVETTHGVVTLTGTVDSPGHFSVVESVVRRVNGVKGIDNRLACRPT